LPKNVVPTTFDLVSGTEVIGAVDVTTQCSGVDSAEWTVTVTFSDGVLTTSAEADTKITLSDSKLPAPTVVSDTFATPAGVNSFSATLFTDLTFTPGDVYFSVITSVGGASASLTSATMEACFDCGKDAYYFVGPKSFDLYGFEVNAYSDDDAHTIPGRDYARFMHTQMHDIYDDFPSNYISEEVSTCLIIQEDNVATPIPNSGGGNITFTFDESFDEVLEVELFNVEDGATVYYESVDGSITSIDVEEMEGSQIVYVFATQIVSLTVAFDSKGAVCGIKTCRDAVEPSPGGNGPPISTPTPTQSPTTSPAPSAAPSGTPSATPSAKPSSTPSASPSGTPSASPSGSFYPSSAPSSTPTESAEPSASPSATPSAAPSESFAPTDCYEKYGITEEDIISQVPDTTVIPENAIRILTSDKKTVTIGEFLIFD
jgi:hypothetical protein